MTDSYTLNSYKDDVETAVDEIEGAHSTMMDAVGTLRSEWDSLVGELDEARSQLEENESWTECFDGEDAYDVREELTEWRELGDVDDVREIVEQARNEEDLKLLVERQGALIARLATALDEIGVIVDDELTIGGLVVNNDGE